jgi:hypothetical protein
MNTKSTAAPFLHLRTDHAPVGAERRQGLQQGAPHEMFDRVLGILLVEEILHTDVDDPRGHVGALQELADLDKAVRVITAQGAAQHAVDHLRARDDLLEVLPGDCAGPRTSPRPPACTGTAH